MPGPYTSTRKNENMNIIEITDLAAPELAVYTLSLIHISFVFLFPIIQVGK